jgi:hypothetical protein
MTVRVCTAGGVALLVAVVLAFSFAGWHPARLKIAVTAVTAKIVEYVVNFIKSSEL